MNLKKVGLTVMALLCGLSVFSLNETTVNAKHHHYRITRVYRHHRRNHRRTRRTHKSTRKSNHIPYSFKRWLRRHHYVIIDNGKYVAKLDGDIIKRNPYRNAYKPARHHIVRTRRVIKKSVPRHHNHKVIHNIQNDIDTDENNIDNNQSNINTDDSNNDNQVPTNNTHNSYNPSDIINQNETSATAPVVSNTPVVNNNSYENHEVGHNEDATVPDTEPNLTIRQIQEKLNPEEFMTPEQKTQQAEQERQEDLYQEGDPDVVNAQEHPYSYRQEQEDASPYNGTDDEGPNPQLAPPYDVAEENALEEADRQQSLPARDQPWYVPNGTPVSDGYPDDHMISTNNGLGVKFVN